MLLPGGVYWIILCVGSPRDYGKSWSLVFLSIIIFSWASIATFTMTERITSSWVCRSYRSELDLLTLYASLGLLNYSVKNFLFSLGFYISLLLRAEQCFLNRHIVTVLSLRWFWGISSVLGQVHPWLLTFHMHHRDFVSVLLYFWHSRHRFAAKLFSRGKLSTTFCCIIMILTTVIIGAKHRVICIYSFVDVSYIYQMLLRKFRSLPGIYIY